MLIWQTHDIEKGSQLKPSNRPKAHGEVHMVACFHKGIKLYKGKHGHWADCEENVPIHTTHTDNIM